MSGVVYRVKDDERFALDAAEPGYESVRVNVLTHDRKLPNVLTYIWTGESFAGRPYDWYLSIVDSGVVQHGLSAGTVTPVADPLAPGVRVAGPQDLSEMTSILSENLLTDDARYTVHPGDLSWWIHHDDPRHPDTLTLWLQDDSGLLVLDERQAEINVFTRPGASRVPLIEWSQRRLGGSAEVGWVSDADDDLVGYLESSGYEPVWVYRTYEWDLTNRLVPAPERPDGWELRPLQGEAEADTRRAASHAAFESTMDPAMHLDRYLRFMRSPVYNGARDLVAVAPDGRVASFMVWWPDPSGIAQIEPFGTHPDFQRQGIGTALLRFGLARMASAGVTKVRVSTDEPRAATDFYKAAGFVEVGRLRWWKKGSTTQLGLSNRLDPP